MKSESEFLKSVHDKYELAVKLEAEKRRKLRKVRVWSSVAAAAACFCLVFAGVHYLPALDKTDDAVNETGIVMFANAPAGAFESEQSSDSNAELDSEKANYKSARVATDLDEAADSGDLGIESFEKVENENTVGIDSFGTGAYTCSKVLDEIESDSDADENTRYLVALSGVFDFALPSKYSCSVRSPEYGKVEYLADNGTVAVYAFFDEPDGLSEASELDETLGYCTYLDRKMFVSKLCCGSDKLILLMPCEYFDVETATAVADSVNYTDAVGAVAK